MKQITDVSTMGIDVAKICRAGTGALQVIRQSGNPGFPVPSAGLQGRSDTFYYGISTAVPRDNSSLISAGNFNSCCLMDSGCLPPTCADPRDTAKEYLDMDNYKNRLNSVADAAEGAKWLIENGYTTSEMLGVKGASYGGYMVMALVTEYPDLFAAGWDQVGIVNFVTFWKIPPIIAVPCGNRNMDPLSDPEFLKSISPIHKVDKIKCPMMIVHGENDPRVPIGEAPSDYSKTERTRHGGGFADFPDEGHGVGKLENRLEAYRKMADFFLKHLKK